MKKNYGRKSYNNFYGVGSEIVIDDEIRKAYEEHVANGGTMTWEAFQIREGLQQCGMNFSCSQQDALVIEKDAPMEIKVLNEGTEDAMTVITIKGESPYNGLRVPTQAPIIRDDTLDGLVYMGTGYTIMQNMECAGIMEDIVGKDGIQLEHGGSIKNCDRLFVAAKLPTPMEIADDFVERYILITWSHTGKAKITIRFLTKLSNNVYLNLSGVSHHEVHVRHTKNGPKRLAEAANVLSKAYNYFKDIEESFMKLADDPFDNAAFDTYLSILFPDPEQKEGEKAKRSRNAGHREAIKALGTVRTKWDAFVQTCEFVDHEGSVRNSKKDAFSTGEVRIDSAWFGKGSQTKTDAYKLLTGQGKKKLEDHTENETENENEEDAVTA